MAAPRKSTIRITALPRHDRLPGRPSTPVNA